MAFSAATTLKMNSQELSGCDQSTQAKSPKVNHATDIWKLGSKVVRRCKSSSIWIKLQDEKYELMVPLWKITETNCYKWMKSDLILCCGHCHYKLTKTNWKEYNKITLQYFHENHIGQSRHTSPPCSKTVSSTTSLNISIAKAEDAQPSARVKSLITRFHMMWVRNFTC